MNTSTSSSARCKSCGTDEYLYRFDSGLIMCDKCRKDAGTEITKDEYLAYTREKPVCFLSGGEPGGRCDCYQCGRANDRNSFTY